MNKQVLIVQYRWAGKWGPFRIRSACEECDLTRTIIKNLIKNELKRCKVRFVVKPWLDNWVYCLLRGGWHAPIVFVNGKLISQGVVVNKNKLVREVKRLC